MDHSPITHICTESIVEGKWLEYKHKKCLTQSKAVHNTKTFPLYNSIQYKYIFRA